MWPALDFSVGSSGVPHAAPAPSAGFASSKGSGLRGEHSEAPKNLVRVGTRRCLRG